MVLRVDVTEGFGGACGDLMGLPAPGEPSALEVPASALRTVRRQGASSCSKVRVLIPDSPQNWKDTHNLLLVFKGAKKSFNRWDLAVSPVGTVRGNLRYRPVEALWTG